MINEKELNLTQISPTKRDFYQIWTELLDVSKKLSERWDPTSTNETDPGIVLLKVLTACTDKLNYNIDKSVLELFMPSVTQEDSMRKLCDLLGYNMKYYQSATTDVTISYKGNLLNDDSKIYTFTLPKFTQIKNSSSDISYTTLKECSFTVGKSQDTAIITSNKVPCIEGSYQVCSTNDGELITIDHIDDNYRFYLPEAAIAENGIFVSNLANNSYSAYWAKVDNLNTVISGKAAWKFGFDSYRQMPYIQFPEDISTLIEDGLKIEYIRTSGISGNVSARTLSKVALTKEIETNQSEDGNKITISADDLIAVNTQATTNGANLETINAAYNNYKKIIGTFDTLVTCRDYMNKIYNLYNEETNVPIVSNVIVSDIRDDINRAHVLCSFNEYGITYIDKANTITKQVDGKAVEEKEINNFELLLYPFKTIYGVNNSSEYEGSFRIDKTVVDPLIKPGIEEAKTISHEIKTPKDSEIACIKNYLKLNARITTTYKVNTIEEESILKNIYTNIYKNFNMRQMDFGEDIPYDLILSCIEEADERIKNVSLDEPIIYTKFMFVDGNEYDCIDSSLDNDKTEDVVKRAYNKLLLRNVLAGRVPLFKYNTDFKPGLNEMLANNKDFILSSNSDKKITSVSSQCTIDTSGVSESNSITLTENEVIQFRAPNFITEITYPAFVHYRLVLSDEAAVINKNTEYQLKKGENGKSDEKLYIMYTSESTTDSSTDVVKSIYYGPGAIIKPNFDLRDSAEVNKGGASWTKVLKSDTDFVNQYTNETDKKDTNFGMLTLGSNEQIEIRKAAEVKLNESQTYIYWTLNKGSLDEKGKIKFNEIIENEKYTYTLKDGEYFYYTDQNKLDLAFYGNGTELIFIGGNPSTYIPQISSEEEVTVETISNFGIDQIPWVLCNFSASTYMILKEYQYVNLTAGDKLKSELSFTGTTGTGHSLDNNFKTLQADSKVDYTSAGTPGSLINIAVKEATWEARSKLELNVSPTKTQRLRKTDKVTDAVTLYYTNKSTETITTKTITPSAPIYPIDIATSISCISIGDAFEIPEESQESFKVKQFKKETFGIYEGTTLKKDLSASLNNFNNYWTKCSLKDLKPENKDTKLGFKLDFVIPKNNYGLLFIYCTNGSSAVTDKSGVYLTYSKTLSEMEPVIFNNKDKDMNDVWWPGFEGEDTGESGAYYRYLKYGINIIKLAGATNADKAYYLWLGGYYEGTSDVVLIGQLDLIDNSGKDDGIDLKRIPYIAVDAKSKSDPTLISKSEQILKDIRTIDPDHSFYYNCLMDNSTAIDFNDNLDDAEKETLLTPMIWYDYNNINNKFVITEISDTDMKKGITIARTSKR